MQSDAIYHDSKCLNSPPFSFLPGALRFQPWSSLGKCPLTIVLSPWQIAIPYLSSSSFSQTFLQASNLDLSAIPLNPAHAIGSKNTNPSVLLHPKFTGAPDFSISLKMSDTSSPIFPKDILLRTAL